MANEERMTLNERRKYLRLVGSVLIEMHDECQAGRRYFSLESMHNLKEPEELEMAPPSPLRLAPIH